MRGNNPLHFGMEIELEETQPFRTEGWRVDHDGTLRSNGYEFISSGKQDQPTLIQNLAGLVAEIDGRYQITHRCSTHIHVDCTELSPYQTLSMLIGLIANDDTFFAFNEDRKQNNFCCPTFGSASVFSAFYQVCCRNQNKGDSGSADYISEEQRGDFSYNCKYLSVNPMVLSTLGTLELRHFQPILDTAVASEIMGIITSVYNHAKATRPRTINRVIQDWRSARGFEHIEYEIDWVCSALEIFQHQRGQ